MIYTVTLNPALDKTVEIEDFSVNAVNRIQSVRTDPGGKGINVSKVIHALGGQSTAMGILGGATGQTIADCLTDMGLTCDFTFVPGQTRTNLKIIDPKNHTNTDINEPGKAVSPAVFEELLTKLTSRLKSGDIVVLSGSLPSGAPADLYKVWGKACADCGAKVFLDADGDLLKHGLQSIPYLIKPNQEELSHLSGHDLEDISGLIATGKQLTSTGIAWVAISLGADGALFLHDDAVYRAKGICVPVGSTVGAGDSMVAALALGCERNLSDMEIIRLAMATSAANVMCSGSQPAERQTVEQLLFKAEIECL